MLSLILSSSNHGMLIGRPLAAQLSYLLIYLSNVFLGVPGEAGRIPSLRVTGAWPSHLLGPISRLFVFRGPLFQFQTSIFSLPTQRLPRGSRLQPSAFGPSIYFLAPFHGILGGRPPDTESQSPFSTFQCPFSGFRRPFSRFQSRFFGFQS